MNIKELKLTELERLQIKCGEVIMKTLPDLAISQVSGEVKDIYHDIMWINQAPHVNWLYRALANHPEFLINSWRGVRPIILSDEYKVNLNKLKSQASDFVSKFSKNFKKVRPNNKVQAIVDDFSNMLPNTLLCATSFYFGAPIAKERAVLNSTYVCPKNPLEGLKMVEMVDAPQSVQAIYNAAMKAHLHTGVASFYRWLGNWPEVIEVMWSNLEPMVTSKDFTEEVQKVIDLSTKIVWDSGMSVKDSKCLNYANIDDVRSFLSLFRIHGNPAMLIVTSAAKAMMLD